LEKSSTAKELIQVKAVAGLEKRRLKLILKIFGFAL
jgi:hypothetical protein